MSDVSESDKIVLAIFIQFLGINGPRVSCNIYGTNHVNVSLFCGFTFLRPAGDVFQGSNILSLTKCAGRRIWDEGGSNRDFRHLCKKGCALTPWILRSEAAKAEEFRKVGGLGRGLIHLRQWGLNHPFPKQDDCLLLCVICTRHVAADFTTAAFSMQSFPGDAWGWKDLCSVWFETWQLLSSMYFIFQIIRNLLGWSHRETNLCLQTSSRRFRRKKCASRSSWPKEKMSKRHFLRDSGRFWVVKTRLAVFLWPLVGPMSRS